MALLRYPDFAAEARRQPRQASLLGSLQPYDRLIKRPAFGPDGGVTLACRRVRRFSGLAVGTGPANVGFDS